MCIELGHESSNAHPFLASMVFSLLKNLIACYALRVAPLC